MRRLLLSAICLSAATAAMAQGWPSAHKGVMLQAFYWDSYDATAWSKLESQADELSDYFNLVWIPQSASCGGKSMGYDDLYWFSHYDSSFGTEEQLRSMIGTFKSKGIGTIADVVINHRKGETNWVDFPAETYNGTTYQLFSTDICKGDDGGNTQKWINDNGLQGKYALSDNYDTGDDFNGARDLDHNSPNVQANVKAYLRFLLDELGYTGFRYDMTKGYAGKFTGLYNADAAPVYSVGEYWDGNKASLQAWLNSTKVDDNIMTAAFDFPIRYSCRDAANNGDWSKLDNGGLATVSTYRRYAVTFCENHDTQYRSASEQNDPIRKDTLAVNAYLLAMPGTPCVFLRHWMDYKPELKNMIMLRNLTGISNTSKWGCVENSKDRYVLTSTGDNGKLMAAVGKTAGDYEPDAGWALAHEGYHYRYFLETTQETVWPSLPSGEYYNAPAVVLRAITGSDGAKIVYTLDGSEPTASSPSVANGASVALPSGTVTLKAGLLTGGTVKGIQTRRYDIKAFEAHDIDVYVNADKVGWSEMYFWTWGGDGSHAPQNGTWPGDKVSTTLRMNDREWFVRTFTINAPDDYVNMVLAKNALVQTMDVTGVNADTWLEIQGDKDAQGHYLVKDVTSEQPSAIVNVHDDTAAKPTSVITIDGRCLRTFTHHVGESEALRGLGKGVYIVNGRKVVRH